MQLICVREGRQGIHVGDIVHIPDDTTAYDSWHFRICDETNDEKAQKAKAKAELEEIAKLKKQLEEAESEEGQGD